MAHKLTSPTFEGSDHSFWRLEMRGCFISLSQKTLKTIEMKYVMPTNGPTTPNEIEAYEENELARYAIFSALSKTELVKVVALDTTYEVW